MYRRLLIVSALIFTALLAFSVLGYHSISLHADKMQAERSIAFSEVAEHIRIDVKKKLDDFRKKEQQRPYTDYQYFYAPAVINNGYNNDGNVLIPSPLAKANTVTMTHGMAYGYFQIEPDGTIVLPYYGEGQNETLNSERLSYISNLNGNVLANTLKGDEHSAAYLRNKQKELAQKIAKEISLDNQIKKPSRNAGKAVSKKILVANAQQSDVKNSRANYSMNVFQGEKNQKAQIFTKSRSLVNAEFQNNKAGNEAVLSQTDQFALQTDEKGDAVNIQQQYGRRSTERYRSANHVQRPQATVRPVPTPAQNRRRDTSGGTADTRRQIQTEDATLQARIKEFKSAPEPDQKKNTDQRLSTQAESLEYEGLAKDKDAYDESIKSAEKHKSDSKRETEKQGKNNPFAGTNAPSGVGTFSERDKSDLAKENELLRNADFENQSEPQTISGYVLKRTESFSDTSLATQNPADLSTVMPTNGPDLDSVQTIPGQGGAFDAYEQTVQNALHDALRLSTERQRSDDMVQIRIEPFVPITVDAAADENSFFGSQVFLLRHVQIEDNHLIQGFKLNETELIKQVKESASRFVRSGMGFELSKNESQNAAHVAVLDFDFGRIVLNLLELKPEWINRQVSQLKNWYFAIVTIVLVATLLALVSLWRNLKEQIKLARKKDDFISAVSHELRTPLTTIRMYTEMLEKNWVKTDDKRTEYYETMRQESERLTRLIENVLDFSRIQRGKKRYNFALGDINSCIKEVVEMMAPCAAKQNFKIETHLDTSIQSTSFDSDAVMQIVINLIDNALKYAVNADDKTIIVTTATEGKYVLIEVADHGPGIPHTQRKKIFDEFYRIGEESKREATGTGLGLALVKKFALAHNGFVEAISAKPNGALLRVAISTTIA